MGLNYKESIWKAYEVPVLLVLVTPVAHSYLMFYRVMEGAIKCDRGVSLRSHRVRVDELISIQKGEGRIIKKIEALFLIYFLILILKSIKE